MRQVLRKLVAKGPLYHPLRNAVQRHRQASELRAWELEGRPCPPPHIIKQRVLRDYARQYELKVLVETGTYLGDMVEAMKGSFEKIYSIELSDELYGLALKRFAGHKHIQIIHGDSGVELQNIVQTIAQPCLFWLDGHYSAGCTARGEKESPIFEELAHILGSPLSHVIIVDDARCFGETPGYPNIDDLRKRALFLKANLNITVQDDSIRIIPAH